MMRVSAVILALFLHATNVAFAFRFGLLTDSSVRGQRFTTLVNLAVEDVQPAVPMEILFNNTQLKADQALFATIWQLQHGNILGTIGPLTTQECQPVALSGVSYKVPVFTPSSSSEFSDKNLYPNLFRPRATDRDFAYPLTALVERLGIKLLGVISSTDIYGNGLPNTLATMSPQPDFEVRVARFSPSPDPNSRQSIYEAIKSLKNGGVRVFAYNSAPANMVNLLNVTAELGMVNNPDYQVIMGPDLAAAVTQTAGVKAASLVGMLAWAQHVPVKTDKYKELATRAAVKLPAQFTTAGPNFNELLGYDIVVGYARTIQALQAESKPVTAVAIAARMPSLTYDGATGNVAFTKALDREYPYDLVNWAPNSGLVSTVAGFYDKQDGLTVDSGVMYWPGGRSGPVWDGRSLRDGQELGVDINGPLAALAFFIAALSAWCGVVLIEQAAYAVTHRLNAWKWTLLTAAVWGACGRWGALLVCYGSLDLQGVGPPPLKAGPTLGALAVSFVLAVCSLTAGLQGLKRLTFGSGGGEEPSTAKRGWWRRQRGRQSSSGTYTADRSTTGVTTNGQGQSMTNISSNKNSADLARQEEEQKAKQQFKGLPSKVTWWLVLAAAIEVAANEIVMVIISTSAVPGYQVWSPTAATHAASVLIGLAMAFAGLLLVLHFMPVTPIRGIGALPLGCAVFVPGQLNPTLSRWIYDLAAANSTTVSNGGMWWPHGDVALGLAIVTVALVMGLIGYNVMSMKLSRNSLDVHLAQFKRQFRALGDQLDGARGIIAAKEQERQQLWRMLDLIALCRPLSRDHALATALAEFVQDPRETGAILTPLALSAPGAGKPGSPVGGDALVDVVLNRPRPQEASIMHAYEQLIKTSNAGSRELRLEDIIEHPVTLELLKDAMAKNMDSESLMFYLDIQRFKRLDNHRVRAFMAREIYDTFLARGCKYEVNVSDTLRRPFDARFAYDKGQLSPAAESAVPADFFAEMEREMRNLLQTNCMARLQSTGAYALCARLLHMLRAPTRPTGHLASANHDSRNNSGVRLQSKGDPKTGPRRESGTPTPGPVRTISAGGTASGSTPTLIGRAAVLAPVLSDRWGAPRVPPSPSPLLGAVPLATSSPEPTLAWSEPDTPTHNRNLPSNESDTKTTAAVDIV